MTDNHLIEHTVIDIAFSSEAQAFAHQATLSSFVKNRLLRVVDEVFTAMSDADNIYRIETLEIDLGTVPDNGFREEMERRLRQKLTTVLRDKLMSLSTRRTPNARESVLTRAGLEQEQLAYFLVSGRMPWHAYLEQAQTLEQLLHRVMQSAGSRFKSWLQRLSRRDAVIPRLVRQFSDDILCDVVGGIEPGGRDFMIAVVERPVLFQRAIGAPGHGAQRLKGQVWEFTFTYLLVERGGRFNQRDYMGSLVRQMAAHHNLRYDELLHVMTSVLESSETAHPLRHELLRLLGELAGEGRDNPPVQAIGEPRESGADWSGIPDLEGLRARLAATLPQADASGIAAVWTILVHEQPQLLQDALRYYGRQTEVRRRLAVGFPEVMLEDIVRVLEPGGRAFIASVMARPVLFERAAERMGRGSAGLHVHLWEFTLTYLLVERGSRFNQRDYMGSLVRQMAAHHNLYYDDLLHAIASVLASSETSHPLRNGLLILLGELAEESGDRASGQAVGDHDAGQDLTQLIVLESPEVEALWARLARALWDGAASGIADIWHILVHEQPQLLQDALR